MINLASNENFDNPEIKHECWRAVIHRVVPFYIFGQFHTAAYALGVFGVCATDGTGLQDAFHWLTENLRIKARTKKTQNTSSTENSLKPSGFSFISSWIKTFMQRS